VVRTLISEAEGTDSRRYALEVFQNFSVLPAVSEVRGGVAVLPAVSEVRGRGEEWQPTSVTSLSVHVSSLIPTSTCAH